MCGRFALGFPKKRLRDIFAATDATGETLDAPRYNVAPGQEALVVAVAASGQRRLGAAFFGQPAPWDKTRLLINARLESASDKPLFRKGLAKRRCLVPASGFYEWLATPRGKLPYSFFQPDDSPVALAPTPNPPRQPEGDERPKRLGFVILTRPASPVVAAVHPREPVMLNPKDWSAWLDPHQGEAAPAAELAWSSRLPHLRSRPVSTRVNSPAGDGPELLRPVKHPDSPTETA